MALLNGKRRALIMLALGCVSSVSSCATTAPLAHVDLWLRNCTGSSGDCDDPASIASDEHVTAQAFIDAGSSRYAPHGLYTYFELPRTDGSVGLLELDVPTNAPSGSTLTQFQASYRELVGEDVRFHSRRAAGRLELPTGFGSAEDTRCSCNDGAFELRFIDAGADRVAGTDDDRIRRLSFGRIGPSESFCRAPQSMAIGSGLEVFVDQCAAPTSTPAAATSSDSTPRMPAFVEASRPTQPEPTLVTGPTIVYASTPTCTSGCYEEPPPPPPTGDGGCSSGSSESDNGCSSSSNDSGGGCDDQSSSSSGSDGCGDSSSSSSDSSSGGGCSDSSSSSSSSSSGCEGDTTDDHSSSCSVARGGLRHRRHGHRSSPFAGTGLPLALVCVLQQLRARRLRAARARAR